MAKETINLIIKGGMATASPPLGPALGPKGINTAKVVEDINKKTAELKGMDIPVKVIVDAATKTYEIVVGMPSTSALIKKELKMETLTITEDERKAGKIYTADVPMDVIIKVAKIKKDASLAKSFKALVKETVGTCVPMSATVEGKKPREIVKEIMEGKWDSKIKE